MNKEPDLLSVLKRMHEKGYEFEELGGEEFNDILTKEELQAEWIKIDKGMFKLSNTDIFRIPSVSKVEENIVKLIPTKSFLIIQCNKDMYWEYMLYHAHNPEKNDDISHKDRLTACCLLLDKLMEEK